MRLVMRPRERCLLGNEALGPLQRVASVENPEMNLPRNRAVLQDQGGVQGAGVSAQFPLWNIRGWVFTLWVAATEGLCCGRVVATEPRTLSPGPQRCCPFEV